MTVPVREIIPREIPDNIVPILNERVQLIEEFVNFGSHIMNWDTHPTTKGEENIPPTMLFRHLLDLIDSISILVKQGCGDTSKLLIRGALEAVFALEYLFQKDTNQRAMAFLVMEIVREIKILKKLDPSTHEGTELNKIFENEKTLTGRNLNSGYDLKLEVMQKENLFNLPQFQPAYLEYQKLKAKEKNPAWYRLFNGPKNIRDLAKHLKKESYYEPLYRKWSGSVHGTDIYLAKINHNNEAGVDIMQLRFVKDVEEVVQYSLSLSLHAFNLFVNNRIPQRKGELANWYMTIRDQYQFIVNNRVIIVE